MSLEGIRNGLEAADQTADRALFKAKRSQQTIVLGNTSEYVQPSAVILGKLDASVRKIRKHGGWINNWLGAALADAENVQDTLRESLEDGNAEAQSIIASSGAFLGHAAAAHEKWQPIDTMMADVLIKLAGIQTDLDAINAQAGAAEDEMEGFTAAGTTLKERISDYQQQLGTDVQ
jgi:hypothetical protein